MVWMPWLRSGISRFSVHSVVRPILLFRSITLKIRDSDRTRTIRQFNVTGIFQPKQLWDTWTENVQIQQSYPGRTIEIRSLRERQGEVGCCINTIAPLLPIFHVEWRLTRDGTLAHSTLARSNNHHPLHAAYPGLPGRSTPTRQGGCRVGLTARYTLPC